MNGDEPAFPVSSLGAAGKSGLTKRELFAAMAMQGILSSPVGDDTTSEVCAIMALDSADALLEALSLSKAAPAP